MPKLTLTLIVPVLLLSLAPAHASHRYQPQRTVDHPNVVMIVVDDATVTDLASMPNVQHLLVDQGTVFTRNYSPFPLCCPARATILTGRYAHNHGVLDNVRPLGGFSRFDDSSTLATWLDPSYGTGLFGKYLNDKRNDTYVPPGWDTFKSPTEGETYNYLGPSMDINGTVTPFPGEFATQLYSRQARAWIGNQSAPWFAYLAFVAPHVGTPHEPEVDVDYGSPWVSPDKRGTIAPSMVDDPSVNEADVSDKPTSVASQPPLDADELGWIAERVSQRREALASVDDEVAKIVQKVADAGQLDSTYFVFTSDNGLMQGQHRIKRGKDIAYEPAASVPLVIRGPGFPAGSTYDRLSGLQDLAPTVLDMANVSAPVSAAPVDGVSLLGLVDGSIPPSDRAMLIEITVNAGQTDMQVDRGRIHIPAALRPRLQSVAWAEHGVVAADGWKLVEHPQSGDVEVYDLNSDPYELRNLAGSEPVELARLRGLLAAYADCAGASCR